jgi:hypothetical protein
MYVLCGRKYFYRYIKKLRPRAKGSALPFGTAFDEATEILFKGGNLADSLARFTSIWMAVEDDKDVKFAKTDFVADLLEPSDLSRLEVFADNLNESKPLKEYREHKDILQLVKDFVKFKNSDFIRDLSEKEEAFLHFANVLCMNRKGRMMITAFANNIMPHITKIHGTQVAVDIPHPDGHTVMGYIDLVCEMAGYKLPNGRVLKEGDVVVLDVKTAGVTAWKKHDNLYQAPQLDTYLVSDAVQNIARELTGKETNLIGYAVASKNPIKESESFCKSCGARKEGRHKTCNADIDGKRCGGEWDEVTTYRADTKIVVGERDIDEARMIFQDFDDVLTGIQAKVFPRNMNSCNAFGSVCDYASICGKCFADPERAIDEWREDNG